MESGIGSRKGRLCNRMKWKRTKVWLLITAFSTLSLLPSGCGFAAFLPTYMETKTISQTSAFVSQRTTLLSRNITNKISYDGFHLLQGRYHLVYVPTYEGSNQCTHPKILSFPTGWHGYRYWMSITPYPNGNDDYENPSIVVSNDLSNWVTPRGEPNPVTGIPYDVHYGGHYSDSHLVMHNGRMELWYRYTPGNSYTRQPSYRTDYYYRKTSADGIHWSSPELMQNSHWSMMSLAVNYQNGKYDFWYTNRSNLLMHAVSPSGRNWTQVRPCSIPLPPDFTPWHQDVVFHHGTYYLLQTAKNHRHYSFSMFLSTSKDGLHFTRGVPFYPSNDPVVLHQAWLYRSSFFIDSSNTCHMMISLCLPWQKWYMTSCSMPLSQWDTACRNTQSVILRRSPAKKPIHVETNT